jgi:hypothetical protein
MVKSSSGLPLPLAAASQDFVSWRKTRTKRAIPEALWKRAATLARRYGVCRTARALRLDYAQLKRRAGGKAEAAPAVAGPFVEVLPGSVPPLSCAIEAEYPDGMTLRVQLRGAQEEAVRAVGRLIWRTQA